MRLRRARERWCTHPCAVSSAHHHTLEFTRMNACASPQLGDPEHPATRRVRAPHNPAPTGPAAGGNNENEAAFGWFPASAANPQLYAADFSKLFVDVVREVRGTYSLMSLLAPWTWIRLIS